jgi:hypothetical protein
MADIEEQKYFLSEEFYQGEIDRTQLVSFSDFENQMIEAVEADFGVFHEPTWRRKRVSKNEAVVTDDSLHPDPYLAHVEWGHLPTAAELTTLEKKYPHLSAMQSAGSLRLAYGRKMIPHPFARLVVKTAYAMHFATLYGQYAGHPLVLLEVSGDISDLQHLLKRRGTKDWVVYVLVHPWEDQDIHRFQSNSLAPQIHLIDKTPEEILRSSLSFDFVYCVNTLYFLKRDSWAGLVRRANIGGFSIHHPFYRLSPYTVHSLIPTGDGTWDMEALVSGSRVWSILSDQRVFGSTVGSEDFEKYSMNTKFKGFASHSSLIEYAQSFPFGTGLVAIKSEYYQELFVEIETFRYTNLEVSITPYKPPWVSLLAHREMTPGFISKLILSLSTSDNFWASLAVNYTISHAKISYLVVDPLLVEDIKIRLLNMGANLDQQSHRTLMSVVNSYCIRRNVPTSLKLQEALVQEAYSTVHHENTMMPLLQARIKNSEAAAGALLVVHGANYKKRLVAGLVFGTASIAAVVAAIAINPTFVLIPIGVGVALVVSRLHFTMQPRRSPAFALLSATPFNYLMDVGPMPEVPLEVPLVFPKYTYPPKPLPDIELTCKITELKPLLKLRDSDELEKGAVLFGPFTLGAIPTYVKWTKESEYFAICARLAKRQVPMGDIELFSGWALSHWFTVSFSKFIAPFRAIPHLHALTASVLFSKAKDPARAVFVKTLANEICEYKPVFNKRKGQVKMNEKILNLTASGVDPTFARLVITYNPLTYFRQADYVTHLTSGLVDFYSSLETLVDLPFIDTHSMDTPTIGRMVYRLVHQMSVGGEDQFVPLVAGDDMLVIGRVNGEVIWIAFDKSKFDSTVSKTLIQFEADLFAAICPMDSHVREAFDLDSEVADIRLRFYRLQVRPCRLSGSPHTSLGNSFLCGYTAAFVFNTLVSDGQCHSLAAYVDHFVAVQRSWFGFQNTIQGSGTMDSFAKATYLSSRFIPVFYNAYPSYSLVPTLKCLQKLFWTDSKQLSIKTWRSFLASVAYGAKLVYSGWTGIQQLLQAVIDKTSAPCIKGFTDDAVPFFARNQAPVVFANITPNPIEMDAFDMIRYGGLIDWASIVSNYSSHPQLIQPLSIPIDYLKVDLE